MHHLSRGRADYPTGAELAPTAAIGFRPVYAWKGIARYQADAARGVTYIGGGSQLYVPNLASDQQGLSSHVAYLHSFTSVDWLR